MNVYARSLFCLPLILAIGACSGKNDLAEAHKGLQNARRIYGERDKQIAQLLSIGKTEANAGISPQNQSLLCAIALESMSVQLRQSGALSDVQMRAFAKVQTMYRQRAAEGRSKAQMASARQDLNASHPDAADRVRIAIGCLRALNR